MKILAMAIIAALLTTIIAAPRGAAVVAAAATAQDADISKRVDDYVSAEMRAEKIPGVALGVARDGQNVKARGYGLANVELDVPVKPETLFQTGSVENSSRPPP